MNTTPSSRFSLTPAALIAVALLLISTGCDPDPNSPNNAVVYEVVWPGFEQINVRDVAVAGQYAYVADEEHGLVVLDLSDPAHPVSAGDCDTPGDAHRVKVAGQYAYVADGLAGLQIIDIRAPGKPVRLGNWNAPRAVLDVDVAGNLAFVAAGDSGLHILDVSNPARPVRVGGFEEYVGSVQVAGSVAYLACSLAVHLLDVSQPAFPVKLGSVWLSAPCLDLQLAGSYAFLLADFSLSVVDVNDPRKPKLVSDFAVAGPARSVRVAGNYVYVGGAVPNDEMPGESTGFVEVIDASDLARPVRVGGWTMPRPAQRLDVAGSQAYVAAGPAGLRVWDVSTPANPIGVHVQDPAALWDAEDLELAGDYAYLANGFAGLKVVDVRDPARPIVVSMLDTGGEAKGIQLMGPLAFVANGSGGLLIVNISDPRNPRRLGALVTSGPAQAVRVEGNLACVAAGGGGVRLIDVTNPSNPVEVGKYKDMAWAWDVWRVGNYAYVAAAGDGLLVLEVSRPSQPALVWRTTFDSETRGVRVTGNRAYVARGSGPLSVLDTSNPARPVPLAELSLFGGPADHVEVAGDLACVMIPEFSEAGMRVVNVRDPANPILLGRFGQGSVRSVKKAGSRLYLAAKDRNYCGAIRGGGLQILDLAYSGDPENAGVGSTAGAARAVSVRGEWAYVAAGGGEGAGGLRLLNLSDPVHPILIGRLEMENTWDLEVEGSLAYVVGPSEGLRILEVGTPTAPRELGRWAPEGAMGEMVGLTVQGNLAYVGHYLTGPCLEVLDVTNPAKPASLGHLELASSAPRAVQIADPLAYVAAGDDGLQIVNVSQPGVMFLVGAASTGAFARDVQVVGHYAFVAATDRGLLVFDVSDPAKPALVGRYAADKAFSVEVVDYWAYVVGKDTVFVLDVSNPVEPVWVAGYDTSGSPWDVQVVGTRAYLPQGTGGLLSLKIVQPRGSQEGPPRIRFQPVSQNPWAGTTMNLEVWASGQPTLTYQWRRNGVELSDKTNAVLRLTNVGRVDEGEYSVEVSNSLGTVTSSNAVVTVVEVPPVFTMQPQDQPWHRLGSTFALRAAAIGPPPIEYQWQFQGADLAGETRAVLTITNFQDQQAGAYVCVARNPFGSTASHPARVSSPFESVSWSGNGNHYLLVVTNLTWREAFFAAANMSVQGMPGHLATITSSEENEFIQGIFGSNATNDFAWLGGWQPAGDGVWRWATGPEAGLQFAQRRVPTPPFNCAQWGAGHPMQWLGQTAYLGMNLGRELPDVGSRLWASTLDSPAVTGFLVEFETRQLEGPPVILVQPQDQPWTRFGSSLAFYTVAVGPVPITHQWQHNGIDLVGATSAALLITNFQAEHVGSYRCVVRNPSGSTSSAPANLPSPLEPLLWSGNHNDYNLVLTNLTWHEAKAAAETMTCKGVPGHLVTITSWAENEFLWRTFGLAGKPEGAWIGAWEPANDGVWRWAAGPEAGLPFWPAGSTQPGFPAFWQGGRPSEGPGEDFALMYLRPDWTNWAGMWLDAPLTGAGYLVGFLVEFETSVLEGPPVIMYQPQDQRGTQFGSRVAFHVGAVGPWPITYQWQHNGRDVPGATEPTLEIAEFQAEHAGVYVCLVGNANGWTASNPTWLRPPVQEVQLSVVGVSPAGELELRISSESTSDIDLLTSTNLMLWTRIRTLRDITGTVQLTLPMPAGVRSQFYRLLY